MNMDCRAFRDWLDRDHPAEEEGAAMEHARLCAGCTREWEATRSLDWALGQRFATASAGFTDRVMTRLTPRNAALDDPFELSGRPSLNQLLRAGLLNFNVIAAASLLLIPWLTGIEKWRRGLDAFPALTGNMISACTAGPHLALPAAPFLPASLPLVAIPAAAGALYLLYHLGVRLGDYLSSLAG